MTREQQLRAFIESLKSLRRRVEQAANETRRPERPGSGGYVLQPIFLQVNAELTEAYAVFGEVLPPYDPNKFLWTDGQTTYNGDALSMFLERVIARLGALEVEEASPPGMTARAFPYIQNVDLRSIAVRDYRWLQRAAVAGDWKSMLILSGGCIEAILYDRVTQDEGAALATVAAKSAKPDTSKWTLADLLNVCSETGWLPAPLQKYRAGLRDYRNVVHPAVELRERIAPNEEEARIAAELLHALDREYSIRKR